MEAIHCAYGGDRFKTINDTYGHEVGDRFLVESGQRLSASMHADEVLGRWGGDEFVVIGLTALQDPRVQTEQSTRCTDG
ncbi:diguanylate cyclase [Mesorhizobium sp. CCNWLW179-1]|uniref:diguanylate cyclase domain-containing protein n=1 Tax=unclassified Mesorhizobium TaxID=325217 RepID=UPI0030155E96